MKTFLEKITKLPRRGKKAQVLRRESTEAASVAGLPPTDGHVIGEVWK